VVERKCHLCGKTKAGENAKRAEYLMAFHYDRRHKGWSKDEDDTVPTESTAE
jgi:hypothetical protein